MTEIYIRAAHPADRNALIALMRRASLANPGDRDALLVHPEAIDVPEDQLRADATCVAELDGVAVGFAVVLPRPDGSAFHAWGLTAPAERFDDYARVAAAILESWVIAP